MSKPMNTWEERFLESFGHDHPWNGECASVNMGNDCDCRTKGMLVFIKAELQRQREEIELRKKQIKKRMEMEMSRGERFGDKYIQGKAIGLRYALDYLDGKFDDIIKKVEEV